LKAITQYSLNAAKKEGASSGKKMSLAMRVLRVVAVLLVCLAIGISASTCYEENLNSGGCSDKRCQNLICDLAETCCTKQWDEGCVAIAEIICQPVMLDLEELGGSCPNGMTCSFDQMANCTELAAQYRDVFMLGNVLGGIYCGEERNGTGIINCPRGSYCPDPETKLPCPAGKYCPYKTQEPTIICNRCEEGSKRLEKDTYGYIVLFVILAVVVVYIAWVLLTRYNKRVADHVSELKKRVSMNLSHRKSGQLDDLQQQKRDLEKLRPKLEVINYRLTKMEASQLSHSNGGNREDSTKSVIAVDGNEIMLDEFRLFDVLDSDRSGDLTFDELNVILGLSEVELREFIRSMNEMANSSSDSVNRSVFQKYFLQALTDTSNLAISYEEAEAMFDELADGNKSLKEINMRKFYTSSMSKFLSDSQILQLIKAFKILKANIKAAIATDEKLPSTSLRGSLRELHLNRRSSSKAFAIDDSTAFQSEGRGNGITMLKRLSTMRVAPSKSGGKAMMIEREFFIQNYPQFLMDVMLNEDEKSDEDETLSELRGVDLCFDDLSLTINVGKTPVNVVNKVSGRLRGKTMTALMGGSGAGKTSLLNALCGRAHYGETSGTIFINGHETEIQKHVDCIGFVPQDDIVYPELTVRENFIYAGKFRLPKGTTDEEIEELADETIANLGLARVANSPVGDVKRRGVSGGEKKRVNIGLELMSLPSMCMFVVVLPNDSIKFYALQYGFISKCESHFLISSLLSQNENDLSCA
jgi:ABC-type multidrug transport system fused ATPase/permease subunit